MTKRMRDALAKLLHMIDERGMHDVHCAKRCAPVKPITPEIRAQVDAVRAALVDEPGPSRTELLEVD